ncbi:hypothetical protein IQ288_38905 [Burkholderia sp. R-69980]|nr:hypothetical protein [Burkholderia sp. R-69980]
MNVTIVEADNAMSVFSSVSSEGVVDWYWEADENGTAGALPDKACDALFVHRSKSGAFCEVKVGLERISTYLM